MSLFIAIAGNIGTGKTTLTRMLGDSMGLKVYFESVNDNPYLADFYADMKRWCFPIQIHFLTKRFEVHREIRTANRDSIQDRSIYEDANIFARGLRDGGEMEERDFQNYQQLYRTMTTYLEAPDLLVYLKKSVPNLTNNIKKRGRSYEENIPIEYLTRLNTYYDEWIANYNLGKVITIDTNDLDFVEREEDFNFIVKTIMGSLPQEELIPRPARKPRKLLPEWMGNQQFLFE